MNSTLRVRFFASSGRVMSTLSRYWMLTNTPWYVSKSVWPAAGLSGNSKGISVVPEGVRKSQGKKS